MINYNIEIENAKLMFKNFSGEPSKFNRKGDRNFSVIIEDSEEAARLAADGWNIRELTSRDEDDDSIFVLGISVAFDERFPMTLKLVTRTNITDLDEESISILDNAEIKHVDLIARPYNWDVNGKTGVKAYLKALYVTIEEDRFAEKYAHL